MSTDYRISSQIRISELLDGRLDSYGVHQSMHAETSAKEKCLTDGHNFIWVFLDDEGFITSLTRWMPNGNPHDILVAIAEVFDTDIFTVHEPQYWGFETQAEWDAAWQLLSSEPENPREPVTVPNKDDVPF